MKTETIEYIGPHPEITIHYTPAAGGELATYRFERGDEKGTTVPESLAAVLLAKGEKPEEKEFRVLVSKAEAEEGTGKKKSTNQNATKSAISSPATASEASTSSQ